MGILGSLANAAYQANNPQSLISAPGGWLGKNSVASKVGDLLGVHLFNPNKGKTPVASPQPQDNSNQNLSVNQFPVAQGPSAPVNYNDIKSSGASQSNIQSAADKKAIEALTSSWDDTGGSISSVEKSLKSFGNAIPSALGKAKDAYVGAAQNTLDKTNTAIAGNKQLIGKNQTKDLTTLADQLRTSIFGANQKLGLMGAGNSSATGAAAKALQTSAGKNRQTTLTQYGDQISKENQNSQTAIDTFNEQKKQADDWEARNKSQLMDEYNQEKDILDSLKQKVPDWKQKDVDTASANNLNKLISGLQNIDSQARGYRDTLTQMITEMYGNADTLNNAAIPITPPAELNTPDFTDQLNLPVDQNQTDENATSFANPNVTGKKMMGYDILGNPYYVDEQGNTVDESGNPINPSA
jgi:hypothetical protein